MRRAASVLALTAFALASACRAERPSEPVSADLPRRACGHTLWYRASSSASRVELVGSWNAFQRPGIFLAAERDDGWRVEQLALPPGEHAYAIVDDGQLLTDPLQPMTTFHGDDEVTRLVLPRCDVPALRVERTSAEAGHAAMELTFLAAHDGPALDPSSVTMTTPDGQTLAVPPTAIDAARGALHLTAEGLPRGKHRLTVRARDAAGAEAEPALATVWSDTEPHDRRDAVVYQVIVDRFRGSRGEALAPPPSASGRAGGTLRGVRTFVESGELEALGANVLWLSPLYPNPDGEFPGEPGRTYSSYHGYWPIAARGVDARLGTEADLDELVAAAHRRGVRVIVDVVPNHVHEQHPYWRDHRPDWFNVRDPICVCGAPGCDWATHIERCWFSPYMPDLDWRNDAVARQATDDLAWWLDRFDVDGLRIDAVPMMPRAATRRIVATARERFQHAGNELLLLGENFTGPSGYQLIRYQLGPFGLDSQFHFPLMWALRAAVATSAGPLSDVADAVVRGEASWAGSGAVMATMIGNHDVTRFASEAAGEAGGDGWTPAPLATDPAVYARQRLALGLIFALPGAPVVYYGDEVALPGRRDPDSRRPMPADAALTEDQLATRAYVRKLGRLRACEAGLRRGAFRLLDAGSEHVAFARGDVVVVASRSPAAGSQEIRLPGILPGEYVDLVDETRTTLSPELTKMALAPFSLRIFVLAARAPKC